jgi:hypothetical protein
VSKHRWVHVRPLSALIARMLLPKTAHRWLAMLAK